MAADTVEARARFASASMQTLALQVREYCRVYPKQVAALSLAERERRLAEFRANLEGLREMLGRLRDKAAGVKAMRVLNREQYDAALCDIDEALERIRRERLALN